MKSWKRRVKIGGNLFPTWKNEKDIVIINCYPAFYSLTLISKSYGGGKFNVTKSTMSDYYCILKIRSLDTS